MGRHRMQDDTPGEPSGSTRPLALRALVEQRRKAVFGTAAGVVSVLALGGVVTLIRGFTPEEARSCSPGCVAEQSTDPGVAEARPTATRSPSARPSRTARDAARTLEPATVRERKRTRPTPGPLPTDPPTNLPTNFPTGFPTDFPRPPWHHGHDHGHGPW